MSRTSPSIRHLTGGELEVCKRACLDAAFSAGNPYEVSSGSGGKHNPEEFWKLDLLRTEYGLIVGSKTARKDQPCRQLLTWSYSVALVRTIWSGLRCREVELSYSIRRSESGGLSSAKSPTVVLVALRARVDLKSEFAVSGTAGATK